MLKKLKIMQGVFALYIICQAFTLLALFLLSSVIYAQTTIKTEIRLLPEGMLKEISEIETPDRLPFEPEMVRIPRGSFTMGEDNNDATADPTEPAHEVTIGYNFEVSRYEITRGEFNNFVKNPGATTLPNFRDTTTGRICQGAALSGSDLLRRWDNLGFAQTNEHPVVCVSWDDVHTYIDWLNSTTGKVYRLLSESEWEYVARAGVTNKKYSIGEEGSDDITHTDARYGQSNGTVAVGRYAPNNFGLYDVHGNVNEIVQDCWHFAYALIEDAEFTGLFRPTTNTSVKGVVTAPSDGSAWETQCQSSVFLRRIPNTDFTFYRGGSWNSALADHLEVTYRGNAVNDLDDLSGTSAATYTRSDQTGFRLARTIPDSEPIPPPELTSPQSGTAINIQSTSTEVNLVIESLGATTISLALADGGELVVNPPPSQIELAPHIKKTSFTLTAVGGGSTMLTLTIRDTTNNPQIRDIQVNGPSTYPEMVKIPSGSFTMGSDVSRTERLPHDVTIGYSFAAGKFELTQEQYGAFVTANPTHQAGTAWNTGDDHDNHPVANIRVSDVQAYIDWLNERTGQKYRLLSESEWEYAARAGTTTPYSTGLDSITTEDANYDNSSGGAVEVGSYEPNRFGLYDVHGNVSEWVADCWHANYRRTTPPDDGSVWDSDCTTATSNVYRSGSFNETENGMRSAKRFDQPNTDRRAFLGVRIARTLEASDLNSP